MKRRMVLFAIALLALPVLAEPGRGARDGSLMVEHMKARLSLTASQVAELETALQEREPAFQALHDKIRKARGAVFDAIHADVFDEARIRSATQAVAAIEGDLAVARAGLFQKIRALLTPEQRAEAVQMLSEMREQGPPPERP
jgi:Spy/CpxP family protein refolding chaperone